MKTTRRRSLPETLNAANPLAQRKQIGALYIDNCPTR